MGTASEFRRSCDNSGLYPGLAQLIATCSNPSSLDAYSLRLDHVLNSQLTLFGRFVDNLSETRAGHPGLLFLK
jgi:hypothetical protein